MSTHSTRRTIAVVVTMALLAGGCGDDDDGTQPPTACTEAVDQIHLTPGPEPRIGWEPGCGVHTLVVRNVETSEIQWWITSPAGGFFSSPVDYAVLPGGAIGVEAPMDLVDGEEYVVVLYADAALAQSLGSQTFTP